jgi:thioredoxin-dependent peroxiredoxin
VKAGAFVISNIMIPMKIHSLDPVPALALAFLAGLSVCLADVAPTPKAGDKAPLIEGKDQDGKIWRLADLSGKKVVLLYFYPKDDTPGCTKEACGFRDRIADLKKDNVEVIGVSFDSPDSHQKFIAKYNLNFPLLADTDGKIADAYSVRMQGRDMARRVSFLIGLDGKIVHVTDTPSADTHLNEMKAAVANLGK